MKKFLYGGQVFGIQKLIFSTNKMAEIIGASELLERLTAKKCLEKQIPNFKKDNLFQNAAGHLKYSFDTEENALLMLRTYQRYVEKTFPGVNYIHTYVEYDDTDKKAGFEEIGKKLKQLRNVPSKNKTHTILNGIRNPRTGGHTVAEGKGKEWVDATNAAKIKVSDLKNKESELLSKLYCYEYFEKNNDKIASKDSNSYIAIIHADGNGLGNIVRAFLNNPKNTGKQFSEFSEAIKKATEQAINTTIQSVYGAEMAAKETLRFRPIIIGGDDITIACSADDALVFGYEFLKNFEKATQTALKSHLKHKNGLTACMGIAFIKKNFPFHYGAALAEELCQASKDSSKKLKLKQAPSSLSFYKVSQAFFDDLNEILKKELKINETQSLFNGPYMLDKINGHHTIDDLLDALNLFQSENKNKQNPPDAPIRKWLNTVINDTELADIQWTRIKELHGTFLKKCNIDKPFTPKANAKFDVLKTTILGDLTSLSSMKVKPFIK